MGGGTTHRRKLVTRILSVEGVRVRSCWNRSRLIGPPLTSIDYGHVGAVGAVRPGAPLGGPAPVIGDAGPAARGQVEPEGALGIPADADRGPLGVPAEVQALLQVPVVVPHHPQLD